MTEQQFLIYHGVYTFLACLLAPELWQVGVIFFLACFHVRYALRKRAGL